ncbi:cytochrome P450 4C1-like [Colias croceus]|uniref:cytochrome P450 4C1-like n=1 Tax=Colias crocea TaxID=72248 RepID=UPI001E27F31B|nr:cytochrome P450 4C1-like [Colias croceus]
MLWQIAIACLLIYLIRNYWLKSNFLEIAKLPGPPRLPLVGCAFRFIGHSQSELFKIVTDFPKEYGNRVCIKVFNRYILHLYNPKDIEIILTSTKNITKNRPYVFMEPWLGTGLLLSTGAKWHKRRKILTPAFHFDILKNFARVFEEEGRAMVRDLHERLQRGERTLNVMPFISDYTLYTICETAMGTRLNSENNASKAQYKESVLGIGLIVMNRLSRFWLHSDLIFYLSSMGKKFKKLLEQNFAFTDRVIEERRKNWAETKKEETSSGKRRMALLDLLLDAESKGEIDMEGIREEVNTFMFEGHDTTAMALTFGLMLLADHEDIQENIYEECKSIFGDSTRTANTSDLAEMKYLEAVIKEILRLYPSVPIIGRMVTEEFKLDDITIPEGTEVVVHFYNLQRREDLFPEPELFKPERFLNGDKMHFTYVPFSAGPRNCIGQRFAMQEMKYMLSEIIRHFKLKSIVKGYRPKITMDLVLRACEPVNIEFSAR